MTTIMKPGEIEPPVPKAPWLRLPERETLFARRGERCKTLAKGHVLEEYLLFMAKVAEAQQEALNSYGQTALPDAALLHLCRQHGMPPLARQNWQRDASWHGALREIIGMVRDAAKPATKSSLDRLLAEGGPAFEAMADRLLAGDYAGIDLAAAPLVGAALQVYWMHLVTTLGRDAFERSAAPNLCPVCASPPLTSIVHHDGIEKGQRYLHCSLCASEWHMVRIKCTTCQSTKDIAYHGIAGDAGAIKAETCDECQSYLKIMSMEHDPNLEPTVDDLASLPLDILMDKAGFMRSSASFFLIPAEEVVA
ncbi:MAG: formate dehydrogenase accessory protein FdhE [Desulfobulbaceae bacterium]|jgi:FdhE protein|nr:formate dehydrogenase accessory protein FdhE [Desulfobulbaceae bacterium]